MDHRKDKRFVERNKVFVKSASEAKEIPVNKGINAHTHDISLSGARIRSRQYLPVGSIVRIVIELKSSRQSVKLDGEIKWVKPSEEDKGLYESGVEFLHSISQTLLSLIKHLYAEKSGIPSIVTH